MADPEGGVVRSVWGRCTEEASKVGEVVTLPAAGAKTQNAESKCVEEEVFGAVEGALVRYDHSSSGGFKEPLDPIVFGASRKMRRDESSSKRWRSIQSRGNVSGHRSRLLISTLSNSITDTKIFNCNRRIKSLDNGIEELRLWGLAKEIGVVEMLRKATCEDGNLF